MFRRARGARTRMLAAILVFLLGLSPVATQAHLDPKTDPTAVIVYAEINRVDLTEDEDDGFDGDAELFLVLNLEHVDHGSSRFEFTKDDYDWDGPGPSPSYGGPWWVQPPQLWAHLECKPREPLKVKTVRLVQIDTDMGTTTVWGVLSGLGGWATTGLVGGPKGVVAGIGVGVVISIVGALDGNEDLGENSVDLPENGPVWVKLRGADGGADVRFYSRTGETPDENCVATPPPPPEHALRSPSERTRQLFDPLREGLAVAMAVQAEPGNPAGLTAQQVADIRQTHTGLLLGLARMITALEVEAAVGFRGASGAVEQYLTGLELDREDPMQALAAYEAAFLQAATASAGGVEEDGMRLPFHLNLTTDLLSTRVGRKFEIGAVPHGAEGPVELWIEGLPEGATATVTPGSAEAPMFKIGFDLAALAPGRYPVQVMAAGSEGTAQQEFLLVVNPKPAREQAGVLVPAETEGDVTTALLNPARDQAILGPMDGWRLKFPTGSLSGGEAQVSLTRMSGPALAEMIGAAALPPGARALDFGFDLQAGTGEAFGRSVSLQIDPAASGITGVMEPAKLGLLHLSAEGEARLIGGRLLELGPAFAIEQPGRYLLVEMEPSFADMAGHWARADVELMAAKQIIRGMEPGLFAPAGQVTRAQFAALLARAMGLKPVTAGVPFSDVRPGDWFYGEVGAAAAAGLVRGMGDGTFAPHAPVSREQVGVMLARAMQAAGKAVPLSPEEAEALLRPFVDREEVSDWAVADLSLAVKESILRGSDAGALAPQAAASRAEAAVMIARFWR